jgi:signal transduction histidine kinase
VRLSTRAAESGQRGFLLTGENDFLKAYQAAAAEAPRDIQDLRLQTRDNPVQQRNVSRLAVLVDARLNKLKELVALWTPRQRGRNESELVLSSGRELMQQIQDLCTVMEKEENRLLANRLEAQRRTEREVALCFVLGLLANFVLLYWAYRLIEQYGLARDVAEAEIRELNNELENRVHERTSELEQANSNLRRSNEDLTRFAYIASHDLQEPLRTVGSYAGLLGRRYQGQLDEQADKYIRFIVEGAKRMQTLVQDLLAYSRVGTEALRLAPTDMNSVAQRVKENLQIAISETNAQIMTDDLPPVLADQSKLAMVLQNLIANAIKFSKPGEPPLVHIQARRDEGEWIFSVSDNGIGFDQAYAEKIFVMFQRLHQVGAYSGTGIGLAICKRIVDGHGGRIWAASAPAAGSTFYFSIPFGSGFHLDSQKSSPTEQENVEQEKQ